jgi:pimeloyl-ACP methyl ester carboxylesterase
MPDGLPHWLRPAGIVGAVAGIAGAGVAIGVAAQRHALAGPGDRPPVRYGRVTGDTALVRTDDGLTLHAEIDEPTPGTAEQGLPTVVLVHGYALDCRTWHFQRLDLSKVTRVISYDQRGHGRSAIPPAGECTVDRLGEDLAAVLDQLVPEGPVVLVGHSMGGMTILALAQSHPELFGDRVRGVAFICTSAGVAADSTQGEIAGFGPLAAVSSAAVAVARSANRASQAATGGLLNLVAGMPGFTARARQVLGGVEATLNRYYSFAVPVSPELARFVYEVTAATPISVVAGLYASLVHLDLWAALPPLVGLPTLVITADSDRVTPPSHGRALAARLPGSRLLELSPAGHLAFLEHPEEVDTALLELVRAAAPRPPV